MSSSNNKKSASPQELYAAFDTGDVDFELTLTPNEWHKHFPSKVSLLPMREVMQDGMMYSMVEISPLNLHMKDVQEHRFDCIQIGPNQVLATIPSVPAHHVDSSSRDLFHAKQKTITDRYSDARMLQEQGQCKRHYCRTPPPRSKDSYHVPKT
jgi:hypothetical protein